MKKLNPPAIVKPTLAYTLDEASEATGIGRSTFYEAQAAGLIRFKKRGRTTLILTDELTRYLFNLPDMPGSN